ncbi:TPA: C-type lectin domain-containing protein, partial [Salmonella enterica subsp. enterica serovar Derby]|nr:C-type lectin domain-containing protein [Salmonella enterica subsp. enterica serovar Derby]
QGVQNSGVQNTGVQVINVIASSGYIKNNPNNETKPKETPSIPNGYKLTPNIGIHKIVNTKVSWNNARKACLKDGAHLAVIDSKEEYNVLNEMKKSDQEVWLGVHDLFNINEWVTVDDRPMPYEEWRNNTSPDNLGDEKCVTLRFDGINNLDCTHLIGYYCEINI